MKVGMQHASHKTTSPGHRPRLWTLALGVGPAQADIVDNTSKSVANNSLLDTFASEETCSKRAQIESSLCKPGLRCARYVPQALNLDYCTVQLSVHR